MTDITDNPPPLPNELTKQLAPYPLQLVRCEVDAAFARGVAAMQKKVESLKDDLQFVERWAVHHGTKPHMTAEQALSCIQHYPAIKEITKSYADGVVPNTYNPFAEIAELRAKLRALEEQKPVAYLQPAMVDSLIVSGQYETCGPNDYAAIPVYTAAGAKQ